MVNFHEFDVHDRIIPRPGWYCGTIYCKSLILGELCIIYYVMPMFIHF